MTTLECRSARTAPSFPVLLLTLLSLAVLFLAGLATADDTPPGSAEAVAEVPDLKNAQLPMEGLLTGGQPTETALKQAASLGYRTVVNLRSEGEEVPFDEKALVESLGMTYVQLPIAGVEGLSEERARQLAELLDDPEKRPMMVHCASGNRVGALLALKAFWIDEEPIEAALELGRKGGLTRLEPRVRALMDDEASDSPEP